MTVYLEREHMEHMHRMAHKLSISENRRISTSECIRLGLEQVYPYPKHEDLDLIPQMTKRHLKKKVSVIKASVED